MSAITPDPTPPAPPSTVEAARASSTSKARARASSAKPPAQPLAQSPAKRAPRASAKPIGAAGAAEPTAARKAPKAPPSSPALEAPVASKVSKAAEASEVPKAGKSNKPAVDVPPRSVALDQGSGAATPRPVRAKEKLVRDSFTMPRADFALIGLLKERALRFQRPTKKSELLRAGLQALQAMDDAALGARLAGLPHIKTGRPKKSDLA